MNWNLEFIDEAHKDMRKLDGSSRIMVYKALEKVRTNPTEDGYGKPLGHKRGTNLTGLMKIKLRDLGIRVVYKLEMDGGIMRVIVVAARSDEQVYKIAEKRRIDYSEA